MEESGHQRAKENVPEEEGKNRVTLGTHRICGGLWWCFSRTSAQIAFVLMYQWQRFHVCPSGQRSSTRAQNVSWQCPLRGIFYEWFHNTCSQWKWTNYAETEHARSKELRIWSHFLNLTCKCMQFFLKIRFLCAYVAYAWYFFQANKCTSNRTQTWQLHGHFSKAFISRQSNWYGQRTCILSVCLEQGWSDENTHMTRSNKNKTCEEDAHTKMPIHYCNFLAGWIVHIASHEPEDLLLLS